MSQPFTALQNLQMAGLCPKGPLDHLGAKQCFSIQPAKRPDLDGSPRANAFGFNSDRLEDSMGGRAGATYHCSIPLLPCHCLPFNLQATRLFLSGQPTGSTQGERGGPAGRHGQRGPDGPHHPRRLQQRGLRARRGRTEFFFCFGARLSGIFGAHLSNANLGR